MVHRWMPVALLALAMPCFAADLTLAPLPFRQYGVSQGLPSSYVYMVAQDADGFLWFATADGLAKYDGIETTVFRHDSEHPGSIASNDVDAVLIDRAGRVWAGGEDSGLNRLDPGSTEFVHYRHSRDQADSLGADDVFALAEDKDGTIWVGTFGAGLCALREDGRFDSVRHDDSDPASLRSDIVLSLLADGSGRLWVGTDRGLDVRDADGQIHHIDLEVPPISGDMLQILAFFEESDGSVLVATRHGVARVKTDLTSVSRILDEAATALLRDRKGNLWAGVRGGLVLERDGEIRRSGPKEGLSGYLPGGYVTHILEDREGGLWFATREGGVGRLLPHWENFSTLRVIPGDNDSLTHPRVSSVAATKDDIWVVSAPDGLDRVDRKTGAVTRLGQNVNAPGNRIVSALAIDEMVWVGRFRGIRIFNPTRSRLPPVDLEPGEDGTATLPAGPVRPILRAPDGAVWANARGAGIARIDPATLHIERFDVASGRMSNADTRDMAITADGSVWLANTVGLERLRPGDDRFRHVAGADRRSIGGIAFATDGQLWLHHEGGLERFTVATAGVESTLSVGVKDGLPSVTGAAIMVDDDGAIWLTSSRGLWRFRPEQRQLTNFGAGDGLTSSEFSTGAITIDDDHRIWAGTASGVVTFRPDLLKTKLPAPPLRVIGASIRRDGAAIALDSNRPINLHHDDRELTVKVRALAFAKATNSRYRFKMEGYDDEWIPTGNRGEHVVPRLDAGDYVMAAEVENGNGIWSALPSPLKIHVATAPWLTWWAFVGYVTLTLVLLGSALRMWQNRLHRRHEMQLALQRQHAAEQVAVAKSNFLATMSHEIRTPLTGVLGMAELLTHAPLPAVQRSQVQAIQKSGDLLLRLVNDIVDLARIEAGRFAFDPKPFGPVTLLEECIELARPLARQRGLELRSDIVEPIAPVVLGDALRLQQILLNLISNALKFTDHGEVCVGLSGSGSGSLLFSVRDTGPGMAPDLVARLFQRFEQADEHAGRAGGSGLGLAISRELVELMGGRIDVSSTPGEGSCFEVELSLPEAILTASPEPATAHHADESLTALIVEDDPIIAAVMSGLLESLGHSSRHAADGLAALAAATSSAFGLILIDLDLPGIDGLALAALLRKQESPGARRILIAVTASFSADEATVRAAGMDAFLRKPVSAESLQQAIERAQAVSAADTPTRSD